MVARDLDIDYGAGGDASGEEDRGKFDLSSGVSSWLSLSGLFGGGGTNHALFLGQKDGKTGVDLSDGEGYKHCW